MMMEFKHVPVMLQECMETLDLREGRTYVDCTLGAGGHSGEILRRTKTARLIAVDKDEDALGAARENLKEFSDRITFVHCDFKDTSAILQQAGVDKVDGVLMDLGVSSYQLDNFERGFSYRAEDVRLDMRMDKHQSLSAYEVVNGYDEKRLYEILRDYGEEKFAYRIAGRIVAARSMAKIETCGDLVKLLYESIPAASRRTGGHPAKRTFQAIRIEVNGELTNLRQSVLDWTRALNEGGRIAVITFHSLEDRIVKHLFRELENDCICDKRSPVCVCDKVQEIEVITRKPLEATEEEKKINTRAESAKLRVALKIRPRKSGKTLV